MFGTEYLVQSYLCNSAKCCSSLVPLLTIETSSTPEPQPVLPHVVSTITVDGIELRGGSSIIT